MIIIIILNSLTLRSPKILKIADVREGENFKFRLMVNFVYIFDSYIPNELHIAIIWPILTSLNIDL